MVGDPPRPKITAPMAKVSNGVVAPYSLTPEMARSVVLLLCTRPAFYARVGADLEAEGFPDALDRLLVSASQAVARDSGGRGPADAAFVVQRIRLLVGGGKVTREEFEAAQELFLDESPLPEEGVLAEVIPLLQRRLRKRAVDQATKDATSRNDMSATVALIEKAQRVGVADTPTMGVSLATASDEIAKIRALSRLPSGIPDLDVFTGGGLWRGALGLAVGGTGGGKSIWLISQAAQAVLLGYRVLFATLELALPLQYSRFFANVLDLNIDEVLEEDAYSLGLRVAVWEKGYVVQHQRKPFFRIEEFSGGVTRVEEVISWCDRVERETGEEVDLLVVDYADRLSSRKREDSSYLAGKDVMDGLRNYADKRKKWAWTASQSTRRKDKKQKTIDSDDTADSMHKPRIADLVLTINSEEDELSGDRSVTVFVAKNRMGDARRSFGPYPAQFARGRVM